MIKSGRATSLEVIRDESEASFIQPLFNLEQVRTRLNISKSTLEGIIRNGQLPILRVAGCRRVDPVDLERFEKRSRTRI
jgi:Helix-turn-helix domain